MNASIQNNSHIDATPPSDQSASRNETNGKRSKPSLRHKLFRLALAVLLVIVFVCVALYVVLIFTPIKIPFVADAAREAAAESLNEDMDISLGETYLAIEAGLPVVRFSPVKMTNTVTFAEVDMEALEIGFSPISALLGQPGIEVTIVRPQLQLVQDMLGPRLAKFEEVDPGDGGLPTIVVQEGGVALPSVGITSFGLDVRDTSEAFPTVEFRSDNDWLVYNLLASEDGLKNVADNGMAGVFSRLSVRDGTVDMHDVVFGLVRRFESLGLNMTVDSTNGDIKGTFSAEIAGDVMTGEISRKVGDDGLTRMVTAIQGVNFSSLAPFMDDPASMTAFQGVGNSLSEFVFERNGEIVRLVGGNIQADLAGMTMRLQEDRFPIVEASLNMDWDNSQSTFTLQPSRVQIANSSAILSGVFVMGLDNTFGPIVSMTTTAKDIFIHPNDMDAPTEPVDEMYFKGWSAPLYGAMGIDQVVLKRGDMRMAGQGRADMVRMGAGFNLEMAIENATADDLKRLWPYVTGTSGRDWFVENIVSGSVKNSLVRMNFPVGSMSEDDEKWVWPENSFYVEMTAEDVTFLPGQDFDPILATGETKLLMQDADLSVAFGDASIATNAGDLLVEGGAFTWGPSETGDTSVFAFSGTANAPISAVIDLVEEHAADRLANVEVPISLASLSGNLTTDIEAAFELTEEGYEVVDQTFDVSGRVSNFASAEKLMDRTLNNGQFSFDIDGDGYSLSGPADIDGLTANLSLRGTLEEGSTPQVALSATFGADDLSDFGFDVSDVMAGTVQFTGRPLDDGSIDVSVDLKDTSLNIADIGLEKARGTAGTLDANVSFDGPQISVKNVDLDFGDVLLRGDIGLHQTNGLTAADFSTFRLSSGDDARLSLRPRDGGYSITLRGNQLDLTPLLARFFALDGGGSGGPSVEVVDQPIVLDAQLERALGFYATTAFNLNAQLSVRGSDLRNVNMQAQFGSGNGVSVTTNPVDGGKVLSVAFNDLGQILRFVGTYPQLVGGNGSLVLRTVDAEGTDYGELSIQDFSIANETNIAQVLGNHEDSRQLIASGNRLDIESGTASFVRKSDRIEITNAVIDGGRIGGTARGFIYTDAGQYDIAGTYIPLFGLNNAFQQLPLFGRLLGGREGEGLIGVTFAVRGDLDSPQFLVNPASILVPGAFRSLFEFRANERPDAQN